MDAKPWVPQVLKQSFATGRPEGPNSFEWREGRLHFDTGGLFGPRAPAAVEPTEVEWTRFWAECDRIAVWNLPETLPSPAIDGARAYMTIEHAGRTVRASGEYSCAPAEIGATVRAFHYALQRLVGFEPKIPQNELEGQPTSSILSDPTTGRTRTWSPGA